MLDIGEGPSEIIRNILREQIPECEVRAFGSRVEGTARQYSDLDLVVVGEEKNPRSKMIKLKEAFEASDIPFRIDLLDWNRISPAFKKIIGKHFVVIQKASTQ